MQISTRPFRLLYRGRQSLHPIATPAVLVLSLEQSRSSVSDPRKVERQIHQPQYHNPKVAYINSRTILY